MPENLFFRKSSRLLNASDYTAVFDNVDWKVSSKEVLCLSRNNSTNHPRLGIVIAKKNIRRAVQRNRLKRIIRESFRLNQHELPALDIILLARKDLDGLDNKMIHIEISNLWRRLVNKYKLGAFEK